DVGDGRGGRGETGGGHRRDRADRQGALRPAAGAGLRRRRPLARPGGSARGGSRRGRVRPVRAGGDRAVGVGARWRVGRRQPGGRLDRRQALERGVQARDP
ncbi:MAG: Cell division inhibitor, partial [uncultured Thermomicrobiales bacterium]